MDKPKKTKQEIIQEWVRLEAGRRRQDRKTRRLVDDVVTLTINSLMDAMTIILVFLLINYSVDPLRVDMSDDLKLPASTTDITPEQSASVAITRRGIVFNDKTIVPLKDGAVDKAYKQGDENSLQIQPLFEALNEEVNNQKQIAQLRGSKFAGLLTIVAHKEIPYRLLTEVMYTAGQAEFQKFKFAVIKGGQRG